MENSVPKHEHRSPEGARRRRGFLAGLVLGVVGTGLAGFAIGASMPVAHAAIGAIAHHGFAAGDDD